VPLKPALVWFRDDLRLADNPALAAAGGRPVLALYLLDEVSPGVRPLGGASRWWLHHSLRDLDHALRNLGAPLVLRRGRAADVVPRLAAETGANLVAWSRRYGPGEAAADAAVERALAAAGVEVSIHDGNLIAPPHEVLTGGGTPFKVFTPFWRALGGRPLRQPLPAPKRLDPAPSVATDTLDDWALLPSRPDWAGGLRETWRPGEAAARKRLVAFLDEDLRGYAAGRDRPALPATSRLSPHLRFGELSPVTVLAAAEGARRPGLEADLERFRAEIAWREFSYHLLAATPDLAKAPLAPAFARFPWRRDPKALAAWRRGRTGYPIVDAGMRQLWHSGVMHNRVRMVAASFLVKHLLLDWREGEAWFWDTLVDADPANNPASWQWVAGSGADAAPFVRVFNPVLQGKRFDPDGAYVRRWVPELAKLPNDAIHAPWTAGSLTLAAAGVRLGETYPAPIVDHETARRRALAAYQRLREAA
jgi:deoxyribodipyrimidine photo-lyase